MDATTRQLLQTKQHLETVRRRLYLSQKELASMKRKLQRYRRRLKQARKDLDLERSSGGRF